MGISHVITSGLYELGLDPRQVMSELAFQHKTPYAMAKALEEQTGIKVYPGSTRNWLVAHGWKKQERGEGWTPPEGWHRDKHGKWHFPEKGKVGVAMPQIPVTSMRLD